MTSVLEDWKAAWPAAIEAWSRFTKLSEPRWCEHSAQARAEGLDGSFAMIRLTDHAVVIDLEAAAAHGVAGFATEILAHEIGHHVFAPGDLRDQARLLARIRRGLADRVQHAPLVANLYTDLLINDRLQRSTGLNLAGVYAALTPEAQAADLWRLYLAIYEELWRRPAGSLGGGDAEALRADARLGARLIRVYARSWLDGAGRFACLLLPYLEKLPETKRRRLIPWLDGDNGAGDEIPDGLADLDEGEADGAIHPIEDPRITGLDDGGEESGPARGRATVGGIKGHREPRDYVELMKSLGVSLDEKAIVARYYRERAIPHLVPFPVRTFSQSSDPQPEGLLPWDAGHPVHRIDWPGSLTRSPVVIPGVTTVERTYGSTPGQERARVPLDCYIGIDCSGSMGNPACHLSYPVLAGAVIALSARRARAQVMVCLSGEPGTYSQTDGFIRDESAILATLTGYLGTGYAFGVGRLDETFVQAPKRERPAHLLVVSDGDLFAMLDEYRDGWGVAARALEAAGGGTCVLQIASHRYDAGMGRLRGLGWEVHTVCDEADLLDFARAFSRRLYAEVRR